MERSEGGNSRGREGDTRVNRGKGDEMDLAQHLAVCFCAERLISTNSSVYIRSRRLKHTKGRR